MKTRMTVLSLVVFMLFGATFAFAGNTMIQINGNVNIHPPVAVSGSHPAYIQEMLQALASNTAYFVDAETVYDGGVVMAGSTNETPVKRVFKTVEYHYVTPIRDMFAEFIKEGYIPDGEYIVYFEQRVRSNTDTWKVDETIGNFFWFGRQQATIPADKLPPWGGFADPAVVMLRMSTWCDLNAGFPDYKYQGGVMKDWGRLTATSFRLTGIDSAEFTHGQFLMNGLKYYRIR